jgi:hypothetical protein
MSKYQPGDYVKVEFKEDSTGESEWMWVRIDHADDSERIVFGQLDNLEGADWQYPDPLPCYFLPKDSGTKVALARMRPGPPRFAGSCW